MMKYEGKPVSDLIMMIFRTNGRIVRAGDELLEDLNLSGSRWQVLGAVKQTPRTVAQIARLYELSRQRVLWHVQALIADGVVELVDNPEHRRAKLVKFTDRGRELYNEVERRQKRWTSKLAASFEPQELQVATDCLRRLGDLLNAAASSTGEIQSRR